MQLEWSWRIAHFSLELGILKRSLHSRSEILGKYKHVNKFLFTNWKTSLSLNWAAISQTLNLVPLRYSPKTILSTVKADKTQTYFSFFLFIYSPLQFFFIIFLIFLAYQHPHFKLKQVMCTELGERLETKDML